ncbi:MAG: L,D-transpeptidase family protein [Stappiaceae bacterium]
MGEFPRERSPFFSATRRVVWISGFGVGLLVALGVFMPAEARDSKPAETVSVVKNDPLQVVVSIDEQRVDVYRGTQRVRTAPISSGRQGNSTPTGIFSILEKRRRHFSNLYDNAPMPYMQRLTWSGIALHQGRLPGYPASHGCVRLPRDFAKDLFAMTGHGAHVVITRGESQPTKIIHASLFQPQTVNPLMVASLADGIGSAEFGLRSSLNDGRSIGKLSSRTNDAQKISTTRADQKLQQSGAPLRMIITVRSKRDLFRQAQVQLNRLGYAPGPADGVFGRKTRTALKRFQEDNDVPADGILSDDTADILSIAAGNGLRKTGMLRVRRKMREIYVAPVALKASNKPLGTHIYTSLAYEHDAVVAPWMALTAERAEGVTAQSALDRVVIPADVQSKIAAMLTPSSSLIVTDRGMSKRHSTLGTDYIVITR